MKKIIISVTVSITLLIIFLLFSFFINSNDSVEDTNFIMKEKVNSVTKISCKKASEITISIEEYNKKLEIQNIEEYVKLNSTAQVKTIQDYTVMCKEKECSTLYSFTYQYDNRGLYDFHQPSLINDNAVDVILNPLKLTKILSWKNIELVPISKEKNWDSDFKNEMVKIGYSCEN